MEYLLGLAEGMETLHSNLVIFKFCSSLHDINKHVLLYIPIWLYSNGSGKRYCRRHKKLYIPIWLYSNGLQETQKRRSYRPLHSNLVIFKLFYSQIISKFFILYIPIWLYSNYNQAEIINISSTLYIPIWLYSNELEQGEPYIFVIFTFQSGYIQI